MKRKAEVTLAFIVLTVALLALFTAIDTQVQVNNTESNTTLEAK